MMNLNQCVKQNQSILLNSLDAQGTYGLCHTEVYPFIGDTGFVKNEIIQDWKRRNNRRSNMGWYMIYCQVNYIKWKFYLQVKFIWGSGDKIEKIGWKVMLWSILNVKLRDLDLILNNNDDDTLGSHSGE